MILRLLLAAALILSQDGELDRLLQQLGDPDAAVRERASDALAARGAEARDALVKGREDRDPEIRARATTLLLKIDADFRFRCQREIQRSLKFTFPEGARFTFSRRPWASEGKALGTVFETKVETGFQGDLEWSIAAFRGGKELPLETCGTHSPKLVYASDPEVGDTTLVVKGLRRWRCDLPVEFKNPVDGQTCRVGSFLVKLAWPCVLVVSDDALPSPVLNATLCSSDIRYDLKPGINRFGGREFLVMRVGCGARATPTKLAWCGCADHPSKFVSTPAEKVRELRVSPQGSPKLEELESISLTLHAPVEETFEVTSPPLK